MSASYEPPASATFDNLRKETKPIVYNNNTLTFLKCNYKYKRRSMASTTMTTPHTAACRHRNAANVESTPPSPYHRNACKIIFRIFILFMGNLMPHIMARRVIIISYNNNQKTGSQSARRHHDDDDDAAETEAETEAVCVDVCVDSIERNHQRNYDRVSVRQRCQKAPALFHHQQQQQQQQHDTNNSNKNSRQTKDLSSSSSCALSAALTCRQHLHMLADGIRRANIRLSTLAILFMALALNVRNVDAGACWRSSKDKGRCGEIYLLNSTKAECCKYPELYFTDREVSNVEFFFATSIGNGIECAPCRESCRNVQCGLHKKCVKHKGRPKCICAPECGAAARRRRYERKLFRGHHEHHTETVRDVDAARLNFEAKSPRDIRSLSSEITNINLDVGHPMQNSNPSQRKLIILQASQRSQQKPQATTHKREPKTDRLLITASVEPIEESTEPRRVQIFSNVNVPHRNRKDDNNEASSETRRGSHMSRHKANKNKRKKQRKNQLSPEDNANGNNSENSSHSWASSHDEETIEVDSRQQERRQQLHHKRKHHHRSKQKWPKDQHGGRNTSPDEATAAVNTPQNTTLLMSSHGNGAASSATSSLAPTQGQAHGWFFGGGVNHDDNSKSSADSADDLTLVDGFYENFNTYGFPSRQFDYKHYEQAPHPVCGTDGRTYNTECQLKKRACRTSNPSLTVAYRGHCKTTCNGVKCVNGLTCVEDHYTIPHCIECKIDCPADDADDRSGNVIDPSRAVCGVDGKTYRSICDINRMICKIGRSIAVAYPGPCREDRATCSDINCGSRRTCLVDLLTHEPRCVSCQYKCARKRRPTSLRFEEGKICGVNNHTYNSWCEMRKDSCKTGFFIDVKSAGECQ